MYWYAGQTYYGIPYSQSCRNTNLERFQTNLSGTIYIGPSGQHSYQGSDCSSAVSFAYQTVKPDFPVCNTTALFPVYGNTKIVGSYCVGDSVNSAAICSKNGKNKLYSAYSALQPGDMVLSSGHVMLVTEVGVGYVKVTHQTTYSPNLHSTWRVDEKWTYEQLYNNGYIGVTLQRCQLKKIG